MRTGLCGAQRVGKTTLARAFAEEAGIEFIATNTRQVMKDVGADPKIAYPIGRRLGIQEAILDELCRQWKAGKNCIFDRTPLDVLAYLEADILRDSLTEIHLIHRYMVYRERCLEAVSMFDALVLVQPGIPIIEEAGAAPGSMPYMEHFNTLCLGYLYGTETVSKIPHYVMPRTLLCLKKRVHALTHFTREYRV